ncbi:MAG TPA: DUF3450 family protein, partial [bacterium]|nr:DUF3450 family protein [bacterium]
MSGLVRQMRRTSELFGQESVKGRWCSTLRVGVLVAVALLSASDRAFGSDVSSIEKARTSLEKWVETQKIISQEQRDLALAKDVLNERIQLVEREIESLRAKTKETESGIAETDKKRAELVKENDTLKDASSALQEVLIVLELGTKRLLTRLPDPIRERVKPLSQRIPDGSEEVSIPLAQRFQNVVGILNEVNKFNGEITVTSEVRSLPDGTSAEVATLYLGLGQAYYMGGNGTIAGIGMPSEQGWQWKSTNESASAVSKALAILKNEQVASF